jgi:hypothetical protein
MWRLYQLADAVPPTESVESSHSARMITLDRLEIGRNIQVDAPVGICLCLVSLGLQLGLVDGLRWGFVIGHRGDRAERERAGQSTTSSFFINSSSTPPPRALCQL